MSYYDGKDFEAISFLDFRDVFEEVFGAGDDDRLKARLKAWGKFQTNRAAFIEEGIRSHDRDTCRFALGLTSRAHAVYTVQIAFPAGFDVLTKLRECEFALKELAVNIYSGERYEPLTPRALASRLIAMIDGERSMFKALRGMGSADEACDSLISALSGFSMRAPPELQEAMHAYIADVRSFRRGEHAQGEGHERKPQGEPVSFDGERSELRGDQGGFGGEVDADFHTSTPISPRKIAEVPETTSDDAPTLEDLPALPGEKAGEWVRDETGTVTELEGFAFGAQVCARGHEADLALVWWDWSVEIADEQGERFHSARGISLKGESEAQAMAIAHLRAAGVLHAEDFEPKPSTLERGIKRLMIALRQLAHARSLGASDADVLQRITTAGKRLRELVSQRVVIAADRAEVTDPNGFLAAFDGLIK